MITDSEKESLLKEALCNIPFSGEWRSYRLDDIELLFQHRLSVAKAWEEKIKKEYLILFLVKTEGYTRPASLSFLSLNPSLDNKDIDSPWLDRITLNSWSKKQSEGNLEWIISLDNRETFNNVKTIKCRAVL